MEEKRNANRMDIGGKARRKETTRKTDVCGRIRLKFILDR
jgi:hypothetical protein